MRKSLRLIYDASIGKPHNCSGVISNKWDIFDNAKTQYRDGMRRCEKCGRLFRHLNRHKKCPFRVIKRY